MLVPVLAWGLVVGLAACGDSTPVGDRGTAAGDDVALQHSDARRYLVGLEPRTRPIPVGRPHDWVLTVRNADGGAFTAERIAIDGGLLSKGQGFESPPRVGRALGPDQWLIQGVAFHAAGDWVIRVELTGEPGPDVAHVRVHVGD